MATYAVRARLKRSRAPLAATGREQYGLRRGPSFRQYTLSAGHTDHHLDLRAGAHVCRSIAIMARVNPILKRCTPTRKTSPLVAIGGGSQRKEVLAGPSFTLHLGRVVISQGGRGFEYDFTADGVGENKIPSGNLVE